MRQIKKIKGQKTRRNAMIYRMALKANMRAYGRLHCSDLWGLSDTELKEYVKLQRESSQCRF